MRYSDLLFENEALQGRNMRKNRHFLCRPARRRIGRMQVGKKEKSPLSGSMGEKRSQVNFIEIIAIFSAAWERPYASRNSKNFRSFFRSVEKSEVKSEFKENLKNMQIFSGASAADPRIKLCPRLAGLGPRRDYSIRPASACRWARPVRRDRGECARNKPAFEAGRLC